VARRLEGDDRETLPVVEERAVVRKRKKLTGGVRARTVVHEDEEVIREALRSEEVEVERLSLDRWVEAPIPVRQEGDATIITLHEEVIVVEKRLKAIEEVRLTKRQTTRNADERVALRREEVILERLRAADEDDPA
jgi:stress response protein YsnF